MSNAGQRARSRLDHAAIGCWLAICSGPAAALLVIAFVGLPGIVTLRNEGRSDLSDVVVTTGHYTTSVGALARGTSTRAPVWPEDTREVEVRYSIDGATRTALCGSIDGWLETQTVAITSTTTARYFHGGTGDGFNATVK